MTARFMGNHECKLDEKGRLSIPSKFREVIDPDEDGNGFIITPAPEDCLFLYTPAEWDRICSAVSGIPRGSREYREFQRQWYGRAEMLKVDKQGRVLVPEQMRPLVGIQSQVVIAGCFDRLEVWPRDAWQAGMSAGRGTLGAQMEEFLGPVASDDGGEEA